MQNNTGLCLSYCYLGTLERFHYCHMANLLFKFLVLLAQLLFFSLQVYFGSLIHESAFCDKSEPWETTAFL